MDIEKHFTVSIFIVHENKVLLHRHMKYKKILPVGGHIEANELPQETCVREAKEETGLDIELYNPDKNSEMEGVMGLSAEELLIKPMHMILCKIKTDHYHIDLDYYASAETYDVNPGNGESTELYWYTKEELEQVEEAPEGVIAMAKEALDILGTK
ncbi:NUDIX hydrolase [Clostridium oryzae]|uniref:Nucleoside triphosphate pyrophosphohydrolase n=1 Tax=Clostridium oryzae TaxID=1450648 RepID=A0A1V4IWF7_9CLOT|nr:NUDIX domain-containing protein [Clostridium oryzae]OPJ64125.1 nucleoside triphosphate pyrophosphohydrolase [Clostridium oryzae]